jgi:hypothetical protein
VLLTRGFLNGLGITLKGFLLGLKAPGFRFCFADFLLELCLLPFKANTLDNSPVPEQDKPDQRKTEYQGGKQPFVPEKAEDMLRIKPAFFLSIEEIVHG